jgi:hypothetical protein
MNYTIAGVLILFIAGTVVISKWHSSASAQPMQTQSPMQAQSMSAAALAEASPATRPSATALDFKDAMQNAVQSARTDEQKWEAKAYLELIEHGVPIVTSNRSIRPVVKRVVEALSDENRERWLSQSLKFSDGEPFEQWTYERVTPQFGVVAIDTKDCCEAVFNLSRDPNLRLEAMARWNRIEAEAFSRALANLLAQQQKVERWEVRSAPRLRTIPIWSAPENEQRRRRSN